MKKSPIRPHHQRAIDKLVATYENDKDYLAIIIGGSVAKNCARDDSDVDFMIVATDEAYARRLRVGDLFINRTDLCDYPGGFVDGKVINLDYLHQAARKGNEPSRAAFDGAFPAYSKIDDLSDILKDIHRYPEAQRAERMRTFYAMAFIQQWLMGEASRHDNPYTKTRAASQLALFAGRLILAYNRVLFPYHKWFLHYLDKCPEKPDHFMEYLRTVLEVPNAENAQRLFQSLQAFQDWGVTDLEAYRWFMQEVEWSWMKDQTPMEDW